ncbi:MAG: hypothetical protein ACYC27_19780 [Armatimonadota bacterium]
MDVCPICHNNAESLKPEKRGLHVKCNTCGEYIITGECLDYLEYTSKGNVAAKTQRWLRETKDIGLRIISTATMRMDDPDIREYVTVYNLKNMYLRKGTKIEYNKVLRKCLELQQKLGKDCVTMDEARDIFPTVDEKESKVMARKMVAAGDLGNREENGVDCIYVTSEGLQHLATSD